VVVNALGDVVDPADGRTIAGVRTNDGSRLADARRLLRAGPISRVPPGANTTLGVVAVNRVMTKTQVAKVAQMAQDGYARAIYPIHTPADGDTVFALSTGVERGDVDLTQIGALAADVVVEAILRAVRQAKGLPGYPAVADLQK
jgi:L-aminopeptidase/D-esterase-like protein